MQAAMFWRVAGYAQASPIEGILDKENFTLDELLDEDGIIQVPAGLQPAAEPSTHASQLQKCNQVAANLPCQQQRPLMCLSCSRCHCTQRCA